MRFSAIAGLLSRLRALKRLGIVVAIIAALLIAGAVYQILSSAADERANPPPGTLVDMGGYRLHLYCTGQGSPTVILIGGAGDFWAIWDPIQRSISQSSRVCTYDRPGLGSSDSHPVMSPTVDAQVTMLHQLLLECRRERALYCRGPLDRWIDGAQIRRQLSPGNRRSCPGRFLRRRAIHGFAQLHH